MQHLVSILIGLACLGSAAHVQGAEFKSPRGFTLKYPDDWRLIPPERLERKDEYGRFLAAAMVKTGAAKFPPRVVVTVIPVALDLAKDIRLVVTDIMASFTKGEQEVTKVSSGVRMIGDHRAFSVAIKVTKPEIGESIRVWSVSIPGKSSTYTVGCLAGESQWEENYSVFKEVVNSIVIDVPRQGKSSSEEAEGGSAGKPPVSLSPQEIEKQVLENLQAGNQSRAESRLRSYIDRCPDLADLTAIIAGFERGSQTEAMILLNKQRDRYRQQQRVLFLLAACARSHSSASVASVFFNVVVLTDERTACAQCAKTMIKLDPAKRVKTIDQERVDEYFAALATLADANPDDTMIRWMAAVACRTYDRNEEGIKHYEKIVTKWNPGPVLLHQNYANLLDEVHRYEEALVERRKAVGIEPGGWTYDGLGNTLVALKRYPEACEAHAKAVALDPDDPLYWCNWGWTLCSAKEYDEAVAKFSRALELDPKFVRALSGRGQVYVALKEPDKAIAECNKALGVDPDYADVYLARGRAYLSKQAFDQAIEDFNKAILLTPNMAVAYYNRGLAYGMKGNHDAAIADFTAAIERNPRYAFAYADRAATHDMKGKHDAAFQDANEAIRLDPKNASAYNTRGGIYRERKEYDKALADANTAIQLQPDHYFAYNLRGNVYCFEKNDMQKAIQDFTEAIRLDPKHGGLRKNRSFAYRKIGDTAKAAEDEAQAEKLDREAKK